MPGTHSAASWRFVVVQIATGVVLAMHYSADYTPEVIVEETRQWMRDFALPLKRFIQPHAKPRDPDRRLKIGYVAADFRAHPITTFLWAALTRRDHRQFEVFCYSLVVQPDELMDAALAMARRITANAPLAVQATKESVLRGLALPLDEAFKLEMEISNYVFQTEDAKEGPRAFAEKRPPVWQGR